MHTEVASENVNRKVNLENLGIGRWMMVQWSVVDWMLLAQDGDKRLL
jgi:hypothetical protein